MSARPSLTMLPDELMRSISSYAGPRAASNLSATSRTTRSIFRPDAFKEEQIIHRLRPELKKLFIKQIQGGIEGIKSDLKDAVEIEFDDHIIIAYKRLNKILRALLAEVEDPESYNQLSSMRLEYASDLFLSESYIQVDDDGYGDVDAFVNDNMAVVMPYIDNMLEIVVDSFLKKVFPHHRHMEERFNMSRRRSTRRKPARRSAKKAKSVRKTTKRH